MISNDKSIETAVADEIRNDELVNLAFYTINCIKNGDYESLADLVHPEYGVVFSPYSNITLSSSQCFTGQQVANIANDTNAYIWGVMDGSGDPISMTPSEYFNDFVFDADYTIVPEIGVDYIIKSGNSLENISDVFPNSRYVEFHFPGTEDYDYLDWSTLRICFEEYNGTLRLTAIIHSEWTI